MNAAPETSPVSPQDPQALRHVLLEVHQRGGIDLMLETVLSMISSLSGENRDLSFRLQKALKALYGRRSERISTSELQLVLQGLASPAEAACPPADTAAVASVPVAEIQPRKPHPGRRELPEDLPRERIVHAPEAPDLFCKRCQRPKEKIGEERSEVLEWVPGHFVVQEHAREKWACRSCGEGVVIGPVANKPIEGGLAGPGLLSQVVVSKYREHLPLNRQVQIFRRSGVDLPVSTLADWVKEAAGILEPVARSIHERVMKSHVVQVDDTGLTVLDGSHPKGSKRGHQWALVGDKVFVSYHYTPTWEQEGIQRVLKDRVGWLQADGYKGYEKLFGEGRCVKVGCLSHARRYFVEALESGDTRAAVAVHWMNALFAVEREAQGLTAAGILDLRQKRSKPVYEKLGDWAKAVRPSVEPSSPLGAALTYLANQWRALGRFLEDALLELSNNGCERALRGVAIGRKNWLFAGSDAAAARAATLYGVLGTAVLHGLDPWAYVRDLIEQIASGWPQRRLSELLPGPWAMAHPQALLLPPS